MQRETRQRKAIQTTLEAAGHPMSPREILQAARERVAGMGIATVYRNLKHLLDEGWVAPVELPGISARYEVAGKEHHHHFVCRECDTVYEVDGCPGTVHPGTPEGFQVEGHEFVLYGLCGTCVA